MGQPSKRQTKLPDTSIFSLLPDALYLLRRISHLIHILELFQVIVLLADWTLDHNLLSGYPFLSDASLMKNVPAWEMAPSLLPKIL